MLGGAVDVPAFAFLSRDDLPGEGFLLALRVEVVLFLADLLNRAPDFLVDAAEVEFLFGGVDLLGGGDEVVDDVVAEGNAVPRAQLFLELGEHVG